jgi:hypothetical protein
MPALLHILNRPADDFVTTVISAQLALPESKVTVVDLTQPDADYAALVEKVFEADSVQCW